MTPLKTMASLQASWFSYFTTISPTKFKKSHSFKPFRVTFSLNDETSQPISPNPPDTSSEPETGPVDPVKLAFARAKEYKKMVKDSPKLEIEQNPVEDSFKLAMEKAKVSSGTKGRILVS